MARARTAATQQGGDANSATTIDSLGGIRVLLNNSIRELYRRKANDIKFRHDITVNNTVSVGTGTGTIPETLMREFLDGANLSDDNGAYISYFSYAVDATSGVTYDQLGYLWISAIDTFSYRAPSPDFTDYTGNLFVSCPCFPLFGNMSDSIEFPSTATIDDLVLVLANAILGKESFQVVTA